MNGSVFPFELGTEDYDAFCVSHYGTIKTRTGAEMLVDIGAVPVSLINGSFLETFNAFVTSDGVTVTLTVTNASGGDLTTSFSSGQGTFTGGSTIALTTGSDPAATENYIYVLETAPTVLVKSTSNWPATEHIKVGYFLIPTATFVQNNGAYINQNWNDHLAGTDLQGHLLHITEAMRRKNATYFSGVDGNGTDDYLTPAAGNVELKSTSGIIYQLHEHTFPAVDTSVGDVVLVANWNGDFFHDITNLYDITADSTGAAIGNNKYFNLVIWGVANKTSEYQPMMVNLPGGFYNTSAAAEEDVSGHDNFSMSREFNRESSTGFLIARITIQMKTGGGTWVVVSTTDLRGQTPSTAAGGVGSIVHEFADNVFRIFDEADNTKEVAFDVGTNVTATTTRTLIIPDTNSTILTSDGKTPLDGAWDMGSQILTNVNIDTGNIDPAVTQTHDGNTLQHDGVNSDGGAFSFTTTGTVTFNQAIGAATGSTIGNLTLANGSITDSSGAIAFGNEALSTTGSMTANSFITASDIGIAADTDLIQLTAANTILINGIVGIGKAAAATDTLTVQERGDNLGITVWGYDDQAAESFAIYVDSAGQANFDASSNNLYLRSGGSAKLVLFQAFSEFRTDLKIIDDEYIKLGSGRDWTIGVPAGEGSLQIANSNGLGTVRFEIDASGNVLIPNDSAYIDFGASQDSGITDPGTYMLFDCDRQTATGRWFQFDNGLVGIGGVPVRLLEVIDDSNSDFDPRIAIVNHWHSDANGNATLEFRLGYTATLLGAAGFVTVGKEQTWDSTAANRDSFMGFHTSLNGSVATEKVRISSGPGLFIEEMAAADADIAGKGQFWVKDDAPNVPMFTDDAGTDHQLAYV